MVAVGAAAVFLSFAVASGGFFPESWRTGTIFFVALAGVALILRREIVLARTELATAALLAALAGWIGLSAVWSDRAAWSLLELERSLLYVAALATLLLILDARRGPALFAGLLGGIVAIALYTLVFDRPRPAESLTGPIGYANALGIVTAFAILLALAFGVARGGRWWWLAVLIVPLAVTLEETRSRGALVALAAGLATLAALTLPRRVAVPGAAVALVAVTVVGVAGRVDLGDRPYYWRAAWAEYEEAPLLGSGAGTFRRSWLEHRPRDLAVLDPPVVRDAHSLYVESLSELGPLGSALVAAALAIPALAGARARRRPLVILGLPVYAAFLVHAGLDWDWEMPAVTISGLAAGAACLAARRPDARGLRFGAQGRAAFLAAGAALIAFAVARLARG